VVNMGRNLNLCISMGAGLLLFLIAILILPVQGIRVAVAAVVASLAVTFLLRDAGLARSLLTSIVTVIVGQTVILAISGRITLFPYYISKTGIIGILMLIVPLISSIAGSLIASGLKAWSSSS